MNGKEIHDDEGSINILPVINLIIRNISLLARVALIAFIICYVVLKVVWLIPADVKYQAKVSFIPSKSNISQTQGQHINGNEFLDQTLVALPEFYSSVLKDSGVIKSSATKYVKDHGGTENEENRIRDISMILKAGASITSTSSPQITSLKPIVLTVSTVEPSMSVELANNLIDSIVLHAADSINASTVLTQSFVKKKLQEANDKLKKSEDLLVSFLKHNRNSDMPNVSMAIKRLERDVAVSNDIYNGIYKQLEASNNAITNSSSIIQVISRADIAVALEPSIKPFKTSVVITLLTLLIAVVMLIVKTKYSLMDASDPDVKEFKDHIEKLLLWIKAAFEKVWKIWKALQDVHV